MVNIRPVQKEDLPQLSQLLKELGYKVDESEVRDRLSKIEDQKGEVMVAVNEDQEILGSVHTFIDLRMAEGEVGEIVSLVVRSDSREQGIGKKLLEEAQHWLISNHCFKVRIRANTIREKAHQFYKHHGYEEIKSQKVFLSNLEINE